jgi:L-asparagine oxygenase
MSTIEVAQTIGSVVNFGRLLPSSGIPTVQSLKPKNLDDVGKNKYSGHFGLNVFPLHTDLSHWALPPHYFLLRCIAGTNDVFTHLLPSSSIVDFVGDTTLCKAVFATRRRRIGCSGLVRAMSSYDDSVVLRWDPLFLRPLNKHAHVVASVMRDSAWKEVAVKLLLAKPGDTLIVDNWRALHGRGMVAASSMNRLIERVYLSEVFR